MEEQKTRTRFAPSPTGYLHHGHILSALYVWAYAEVRGGQVILRIEDHDQGRSRKEYEELILKDLDWFGFEPDDGVSSVEKPSDFRQSDHWERYDLAVKKLESTNEVPYPCHCSRRQIEERNPKREKDEELKYDGFCRNPDHRVLAKNSTEFGLRYPTSAREIEFADLMHGPQVQTPSEQCGDILLKERTGNWTYQFAVAVDDCEEQITDVIRGVDLLDSTARQIYLAEELGRSRAARFLHHQLITADSGLKLSKRLHSERAAAGRENHESPNSAIGWALLCGGVLSEHKAMDFRSAVGMIADQLHSMLEGK